MAILQELTLKIAAHLRFQPAIIWLLGTITTDAPQRHFLADSMRSKIPYLSLRCLTSKILASAYVHSCNVPDSALIHIDLKSNWLQGGDKIEESGLSPFTWGNPNGCLK